MAATTPAEREAAAKRAIDAIQDQGLSRNIAASDQPAMTAPTTKLDNPAVRDAERHDRQLEKANEDSFPASDPPAVTQPAKPPAAADDAWAEDGYKEEMLDEALEESFPASDPPSMTSPEASIGAPARPKKKAERSDVADFLKKPT